MFRICMFGVKKAYDFKDHLNKAKARDNINSSIYSYNNTYCSEIYQSIWTGLGDISLLCLPYIILHQILQMLYVLAQKKPYMSKWNNKIWDLVSNTVKKTACVLGCDFSGISKIVLTPGKSYYS